MNCVVEQTFMQMPMANLSSALLAQLTAGTTKITFILHI